MSCIPQAERLEAVTNAWWHNYFKVTEYLDKAGWIPRSGFGVVDPTKVKDPANLFRCLRSAVRRDAERECKSRFPEIILRDNSSELPIPIPEPRKSTEEEGDRIERMREALARLPAKYREPFILDAITPLRIVQITGYIGCSPATIHDRIRKARCLLRAIM